MGNQGHSGYGYRTLVAAHSKRRDRQGEGSPRLVEPPDLAAGHRPARGQLAGSRHRSTGTCGWASRRSGRMSRRPIARSTGAAGTTSARALWATWAATSSTRSCGAWSCARRRASGTTARRQSPKRFPPGKRIHYEFPAHASTRPARIHVNWYDGKLDGEPVLPFAELRSSGAKDSPPTASSWSAKRACCSASTAACARSCCPRTSSWTIRCAKARPASRSLPAVDQRHPRRRQDHLQLRLRRPADRDRPARHRSPPASPASSSTGTRPTCKFTNVPKANDYVQQPYRKGWEVPGLS